MDDLMNQLTNVQLAEVNRQMEEYIQGVEDIIPTEELELKVAKSILH